MSTVLAASKIATMVASSSDESCASAVEPGVLVSEAATTMRVAASGDLSITAS
jgi:hypothetical protein